MNTLFNKVLGEKDKCVFYFYLKTEGTFWPTQYMDNQWKIIPGRGNSKCKGPEAGGMCVEEQEHKPTSE